MAQRPLRIAINGGGLAGLSLALSLHKLIPDHERFLEINIYESTASLQAQVGAGIGLWPFTWMILEELGLVPELMKYTLFKPKEGPVDVMQVRQGDENPRDLFKLTSSNGSTIMFHRGDFQAVFLNALPDSIGIHTKKRLDTYTQDEEGVTLHFKDGTTASADMLVGADGLQSAVRRRLVEEAGTNLPPIEGVHPGEARWAGVLTYRALVPRTRLVEQGFPDHRSLSSWNVYLGKGASLLCYPVSHGTMVNVVGFRNYPELAGTQFREEIVEQILREEGYDRTAHASEVKSGLAHQNVASGDVWSLDNDTRTADGKRARWFSRISPEEFKHIYRGWEPEVQALCNGVEGPICWAVHMVTDLKTYSHGRVTISGDAAHSLRPQIGMGAGAAICDGFTMAKLIRAAVDMNPSQLRHKVPEILDVYDKIRRPINNRIAETARACAAQFSLIVKEGTPENETWTPIDTNTEEGVKKLREHFTNTWSEAWNRELVPNSIKQGIEMLKERY